MIRLFTKNTTGIAPDGAWFAGDVNALQDAVAAITDLTQALSVGTMAIGESGLQIVRFGSGEARMTGAMRVDAILRGLGGLLAGAFTTTARNAISSPPTGLIILNTTTGQYEWNSGTSGSPVWSALGGTGVVAAATTISALSALFPSGTPPDGARGKLLLTGGAAGQTNHVVPLVYEASISKWVTERIWVAHQTISPVTVTGAEQYMPAANCTFEWIENYSDLYTAGLRPQGWVGGLVANGGSGQVRINYNITATDAGATGNPIVVTNLSGGAGISNPVASTFTFDGWTTSVGVTAPSNRHGILAIRIGNDAGGAATASVADATVKIRMVG